ncbi:hypothetical protein ACIBEJ_33455 [Nonomuraea sp. NPDC050790]|uniref:hypothetical protein n=1 Tax=Nonomuraea sp. NPDC050790 TaxID=3364371 RepID=UPI00378A4252
MSVMRIVAKAVLSLYPRSWRERYGEEVADLIAARPVRLRTVTDLAGGAADAWLHHRPGSRRQRVSVAVLLVVGACALVYLWNPGVRDAASLNGVWAEAAGSLAEELHTTATTVFAAAGLTALLTFWQVIARVRVVRRQAGAIEARVIAVAAFVVVPAGFVVAAHVGLGFLDVGYPVGPLGTAMLGGFLAPIVMALMLPLPLAATASPLLADAVRAIRRSLGMAAILNAIGWMVVAVLLVMGLAEAAPWFVAAVTASALVSTGMAALVARTAPEPVQRWRST